MFHTNTVGFHEAKWVLNIFIIKKLQTSNSSQNVFIGRPPANVWSDEPCAALVHIQLWCPAWQQARQATLPLNLDDWQTTWAWHPDTSVTYLLKQVILSYGHVFNRQLPEGARDAVTWVQDQGPESQQWNYDLSCWDSWNTSVAQQTYAAINTIHQHITSLKTLPTKQPTIHCNNRNIMLWKMIQQNTDMTNDSTGPHQTAHDPTQIQRWTNCIQLYSLSVWTNFIGCSRSRSSETMCFDRPHMSPPL